MKNVIDISLRTNHLHDNKIQDNLIKLNIFFIDG
jgi:hypothetical protein